MTKHLRKTVNGILIAIEGLAEALDVHQADGELCGCDRCREGSALLFQLQHIEAILESALRRPSRTLRRLRESGFPSAKIIAELVTAWRRQLGTQPTNGPALATGPA